MVGWHHRLNRHEFEQTLEDSEGQESLACCSPWVSKSQTCLKQLSTKACKLLEGGFPGGAGGKEPPCQSRWHEKRRFDPWVGQDPLEKGMATHSSIFAWRIPRTEEPGRLQSMGLQEGWSGLSTHAQKPVYQWTLRGHQHMKHRMACVLFFSTKYLWFCWLCSSFLTAFPNVASLLLTKIIRVLVSNFLLLLSDDQRLSQIPSSSVYAC